MPVVYRTVRAQDLERADALVVAAINDLTTRHGFGAIAVSRPTHFQLFSLNDDARGLWVAEENGDIIGFVWSWVCGELWFLAQLFVSPAHQGRGIGNELLKRTFDHAEKSGAVHKALITFAFNTVSQGLYMRHGLFPQCPIYNLSIARERLTGLQPSLRHERIEDTTAHLQNLAEIDMQTLGVSRAKHHAYLIRDGAKGFLLHAGERCSGYVYIGSDGHIGPLAVARDDMLGAAFETALHLAAQGSSLNVSAFVPGTGTAALRLAAEHGLRITLPMMLMATPGFGDWTRYLPRNPGFM